MNLSENTKEWIKDILIAVIIAVVILQFIQPTIVREHSMENTFIEHDYLFVAKKAYSFGKGPKRGDVIIFQSDLALDSGKGKKLLIKRVIGIPGDTISISGGIVYLNGIALDEPYTKDGYTLTEMGEVTVPENSYFCMGDNRQNSADSRDSRIGFVEKERIRGKAFVRLLPISKIGGVYKNFKGSTLDQLNNSEVNK
ncbi:MAG: signal peptidase I [Bacillota bacterium]|nr:signal peptidase I [Bacillota bacterium]